MNNDNNKKQIIDLIDFYRKWPSLKKYAVTLKSNADISEDEKETLHWLIKLADRVGKSDIEPLN